MFELVIGMFTFSFIGFWMTVALLLSGCFWSASEKNKEYAIYAIILYLIFFPSHPLKTFFSNFWDGVAYFFEYLLIGVIYSVPRYLLFLRDVLGEVNKVKYNYISKQKLDIKVTDAIPEELQQDWNKYKYANLTTETIVTINEGLSPLKQYNRISYWIVVFPFSMINVVFGRSIKLFLEWSWEHLKVLYKMIYTDMIKKYVHISDIEKNA